MKRNENFEKLLEILGVREENFINITDDNVEIRENIPQAETKILHVKARPDDHHLREFICGFLRQAFEDLLQNHFISLGTYVIFYTHIPDDSADSQGFLN